MNKLNQQNKTNEDVIKFCNILRNIDKQTDSVRLVKKMNQNRIENGEKEIKRLLDNISKLQLDLTGNEINLQNYYNYKLHESADKQSKLLNDVKTRLTENTEAKVVLQ